MHIDWKWLWDRLALGVPFILFAALLYNEWAALGLALSLFNGESFIGYWMKHGVPFGGAIAIAVICSTFDISMWFRAFFAIREAYGHARSIYEMLESQVSFAHLNGERTWILQLRRWGLRQYLKRVPQPTAYHRIGSPYRTHAREYGWLCFYGFTPGGILSGVGYAVAFHLNPTLAFLTLAAANAAKMVCFGYLALHVSWKLTAVIIIFGMPHVTDFVQRQYRKHGSPTATQEIAPT